MLFRSGPPADRCDLAFTVAKAVRGKALDTLAGAHDVLGYAAIRCDDDIGTISLLGRDLRCGPGMTARLLATLGEAGIRFELLSISAHDISLAVRSADLPLAIARVRAVFCPVRPHQLLRPGRRRDAVGQTPCRYVG